MSVIPSRWLRACTAVQDDEVGLECIGNLAVVGLGHIRIAGSMPGPHDAGSASNRHPVSGALDDRLIDRIDIGVVEQ